MPENPHDIERLIAEEKAALLPEEREQKPKVDIGKLMNETLAGTSPADASKPVDQSIRDMSHEERMQQADAKIANMKKADDAGMKFTAEQMARQKEAGLELDLPKGMTPNEARGQIKLEAQAEKFGSTYAALQAERAGLDEKQRDELTANEAQMLSGLVQQAVDANPELKTAVLQEGVTNSGASLALHPYNEGLRVLNEALRNDPNFSKQVTTLLETQSDANRALSVIQKRLAERLPAILKATAQKRQLYSGIELDVPKDLGAANPEAARRSSERDMGKHMGAQPGAGSEAMRPSAAAPKKKSLWQKWFGSEDDKAA